MHFHAMAGRHQNTDAVAPLLVFLGEQDVGATVPILPRLIVC